MLNTQQNRKESPCLDVVPVVIKCLACPTLCLLPFDLKERDFGKLGRGGRAVFRRLRRSAKTVAGVIHRAEVPVYHSINEICSGIIGINTKRAGGTLQSIGKSKVPVMALGCSHKSRKIRGIFFQALKVELQSPREIPLARLFAALRVQAVRRIPIK